MSAITPESKIIESIPSKDSSLYETKGSLLTYLNSFLALTWLTGMASKTKTAQKAISTIKATKTAASIAKFAQGAKTCKTLATWISRAAKGVGLIAAPFTGGTSLAAGLAAGFALDIVAGEAIDAGITMYNGGKVLEESRDDYIQLGDWAGAKLYSLVA